MGSVQCPKDRVCARQVCHLLSSIRSIEYIPFFRLDLMRVDTDCDTVFCTWHTCANHKVAHIVGTAEDYTKRCLPFSPAHIFCLWAVATQHASSVACSDFWFVSCGRYFYVAVLFKNTPPRGCKVFIVSDWLSLIFYTIWLAELTCGPRRFVSSHGTFNRGSSQNGYRYCFISCSRDSRSGHTLQGALNTLVTV